MKLLLPLLCWVILITHASGQEITSGDLISIQAKNTSEVKEFLKSKGFAQWKEIYAGQNCSGLEFFSTKKQPNGMQNQVNYTICSGSPTTVSVTTTDKTYYLALKKEIADLGCARVGDQTINGKVYETYKVKNYTYFARQFENLYTWYEISFKDQK